MAAKCVASSCKNARLLTLLTPRPSIPNVLWAQRKENVLLKIDLPDVKNEKIEIEGAKVRFNGESQGRSYTVEIDLHADVVKEVGGVVEVFLVSQSTGEQVDCSAPCYRDQVKEEG